MGRERCKETTWAEGKWVEPRREKRVHPSGCLNAGLWMERHKLSSWRTNNGEKGEWKEAFISRSRLEFLESKKMKWMNNTLATAVCLCTCSMCPTQLPVLKPFLPSRVLQDPKEWICMDFCWNSKTTDPALYKSDHFLHFILKSIAFQRGKHKCRM